MSHSRRYTAAITAAVLMATAGIAVTTATQSHAAPQACDGVWVVVQPDQADPSTATTTCAPVTAGQSVLQVLSGIHTVVENAYQSPGQINGAPTDPDYTSNGGYFWAFCTAAPADTLTWGFASDAAGNIPATSPAVYGFMLTNLFDGCPTVTSLPADTTSPSPSPSPDVTTTPTVSPPASPTVPPTNPPRENAAAEAGKAATWLSRNLPEATDADGLWQTVLGLAAVNRCSFEPAIQTQLARLQKQAKDYLSRNTAGRAGRLAVVAAATGENPRDFGGVDLVKAILDNTAADGQVDGGGNPFSQALAMIGLARTGTAVPPAMLTALLGAQNAEGAFGFGSGASFFPDLDTTGLAIQVLHHLRSDPAAKAALDKAVAWALTQQTASGRWPNDFAPVNTTGLVGSALDLAGQSSGRAVTWLKTQQLANGGLPDLLDGKEANRFATVEGLFLLANTTYLTVGFTATCDDPTDAAGEADEEDELPNTGASDANGLLGIVAVVLIAAGGALVALRRRQS